MAKRHTNEAGHKYLSLMQNELDPFDEALKNGDLNGAIQICRKCLPYLKELIPHMKSETLQKVLNTTADQAEEFIGKLEKNGPTFRTIYTFFGSVSINLVEILKSLVVSDQA